jgi:hypothetical protein
LARWLLTHEAGDDPSPEALAAAAERVHVRLREGLIVFLGQSGFDSLWARAMHIARRVSERDAAEAQEIPIAALASFITLLFTFVGAALGVRLIHHVWPELPVGGADMQTGEVTP